MLPGHGISPVMTRVLPHDWFNPGMADVQKAEKFMKKSTIEKRPIIIQKDEFAYILYPSIRILGNGEWFAAFNHSRHHEPSLHQPE